MPENAADNSQSDSDSDSKVQAEARSLYSMLRESAEKYRSIPAVIFWKRRFTYDTLLRMVDSLAESLRSRFSIPVGARIGLALPNSPPFAISLFAASKIGAVAVPVNPKSSARELENVISHSGMRFLITTESNLAKVRHLASEDLIVAVVRMQDYVSFGQSIRKAVRQGLNYLSDNNIGEAVVKFSDLVYTPSKGDEEPYAPEDVALLAYSGSTSSSPKAAALTNANFEANIRNMSEWFPALERRTVTIAAVPFNQMFSLLISLLVPFSLGTTVVLIEDSSDMDNMLSSITEYLCDYFVGNPSLFRTMMERGDLLKYRLGTVKVFISGGDNVTEEFAEQFEETAGSGIVTTYGTKEVTGVSHINPLDRKKRKYGSIGVLIGNTSVKIIDEDTGEEAEEGSVGMLHIKGGQVMKEYWNNREATEESMDEGWFNTGDMARKDQDGFYFLYQRRKEAIISDSTMVYAAEVEEVIRQNPKVEEVAVIGVPDVKRGEIIKAYIVAKNGEKLPEKELQELCESQLSDYKRPSMYEFRNELPKNMEGQVIKRILKEESAREK